jgi:hypothetical protein
MLKIIQIIPTVCYTRVNLPSGSVDSEPVIDSDPSRLRRPNAIIPTKAEPRSKTDGGTGTDKILREEVAEVVKFLS